MDDSKITLAHGSGGKKMHRLIDTLFMKEFNNKVLREKKDSAILKIGKENIAFTTDSYVVDPIFFPGGDIGSLAVYGTVNDISVCGAKPLFISLGLVIEEGCEFSILQKIIKSIGSASRKAGVEIVTGDTKVVENGSCDKLFINTSGIGRIYYEGLSVDEIRAGDAIIVSGPIGDHAISVLSKREGMNFGAKVKSDSAPLNSIITKSMKVSRKIRFMRDPTRGGLATTLNEMIYGKKFGISIDEDALPIRDSVKSACELLGLDPLYLACEGRFILIVADEDSSKVMAVMHRDRFGRMARIIGNVSKDYPGKVFLNTSVGGRRIIDMLSGEQLPRIC